MTEAKTIGRKRKKNGFTQISNVLLEDSRLSWRAKGVLCYLMSRPDNWKVNKTDIKNRATEGRDALQSVLGELRKFGYLHIYRNTTSQGQIEGWVWEYDDEPFILDVLENQTTEKPQEFDQIQAIPRTTDFPYDGNPVRRESSTYNNTVINNTDFNNKNKDKELKTNMSNSPKVEQEFEELWKVYPRKIGKKKAFDSFKKARKVKKVPYETIQNGLYRYLRYIEQQDMDEQFIQHGSTFFNQEKWQDEFITTGIQKKPKNALEYFRQKHQQQGEDYVEPYRNGEIIDAYSELLPEPF
jgi:hypothetical protein